MRDIPPSVPRTHTEDLVVVLLATFNGSRYLSEQLDSLAAQTHKNWQLILSDDGSTDDTLEIAHKFANKYDGKVIILQEGPVGSARDNFFRLLRQGELAPYYAFCDQDDIWRDDKLELLVQQCRQTEAAQTTAVPCLVYSDLTVVDSGLNVLHASFLGQIRTRPAGITYKNLLAENSIPGCAMMINAALADVVRSRDFDTSKAIMHDWWLALLAASVGNISYVPSNLVSYRQHNSNTLGSINRSGVTFVLSKIFRPDRSATSRTYRQAAAFVDTYGDIIDPKIRVDIADFASLPRRRKPVRIGLLLKNRTLKQGLSRRLYQLLRA